METAECTTDISDRTSREQMALFPFLYLQISVLEELSRIPQSSLDNVFESMKNRCTITIPVRAAHTTTRSIKNCTPHFNNTIFVILQISNLLPWRFTVFIYFKSIQFSYMRHFNISYTLRFNNSSFLFFVHTWLSCIIRARLRHSGVLATDLFSTTNITNSKL